MSQLSRKTRAKHEKWRRKDLGYLLHAGQRKLDLAFEQSTGQLFVANIARQFGKSFWAVSKAVALAMRKPKARIKYGTAFQTDLTEFILPTFDAVLSDCPANLKPRYKVQGSKFVFPNGSEIKLVGLDKNPNSVRGNVIDLIVIDEAGFVEKLEYIYKSIIIPATLHRPDCRIIFVSTPPTTPAHAFNDFIQMAEVNGAYVMLTINDNPLITEEDVERMAREMGGRHSTTFRRECLCELVLDEDLALCKEWNDKYVQEPPKDQFYRYYHKYSAMDMGRKDHTALVFGYYDFKRATLFIEDDLTMHGPDWTSITLTQEVNSKEKELWGDADWKGKPFKPFRRIADNNNPHLIVDLSSIHNLHFSETDKESLEAMVNEIRLMVSQGRIIVSPKAKMVIGCLKYGIWDKNRKEFSRNKIYGHFDHFAALMYLVRNLSKATNPIPMDHGFENHTAWLGNIKDQHNLTPNARALGDALLGKRVKRSL
ncbi:MAG: hypothetical protein HC838_00050 [Spirulinaceae cyanobacterium RM2_2_10]|nr:hypothetical protein [Spirulinaceae cyanobacterium RM2_2_10]